MKGTVPAWKDNAEPAARLSVSKAPGLSVTSKSRIISQSKKNIIAALINCHCTDLLDFLWSCDWNGSKYAV